MATLIAIPSEIRVIIIDFVIFSHRMCPDPCTAPIDRYVDEFGSCSRVAAHAAGYGREIAHYVTAPASSSRIVNSALRQQIDSNFELKPTIYKSSSSKGVLFRQHGPSYPQSLPMSTGSQQHFTPTGARLLSLESLDWTAEGHLRFTGSYTRCSNAFCIFELHPHETARVTSVGISFTR